MKSKRNNLLAYGSLLLTMLLMSAGQVQTSKSNQPNFIIILADDLGYGDIGCFRELHKGNDDKPEAFKHTPNLDKLSEEGVRFSRNYATGWCAPSRQVLLSGMWVGRKSARENPWIGNRLRKAGYTTSLIGKVHGEYPVKRCFENIDSAKAEFDDGLFFNGGCRTSYLQKGDVFPTRIGLKTSKYEAKEGDYITDVFNDRAIDFIKRNKDNPFMLYLAHTAPHGPLQGKPEDLRTIYPKQFGDMSDAEIRATAEKKSDNALMAAHYAAMVYGLDRGIGSIVKTLKACGIAENTIIIFTSDNGAIDGSNYPFDGHKWDGLEGGIRVPMIVWSNELKESDFSGTVCDRMVSLADIAPTLMGAAGVTDSVHTDGIDVIAGLTKKQPWPEERRYLITNSCYTFQNTGAMDFGVEYANGQQLMQCVYITDEDKIISWNPNKSKNVGVVYRKLPNVAGVNNADVQMKEETPKNGIMPTDEKGINLFYEMIGSIVNADGDILQTWSCATPEELSNYKWWWNK